MSTTTTEPQYEFDTSLEPEVLTDRPETKTLPCRKCARACVVTRFASPAKTECSVCRGSSVSKEIQFNEELETEVLTEQTDTKELPCRQCGRRCVVTKSASPAKTECLTCRGGGVEFQFNEELETETLTDSDKTKEVPCVECGRRCVVTTFATASKVKCLTCKGKVRAEHKREVQVKQAHTVNPARVENLKDALINPAFRHDPPCPFDGEHEMRLTAISHSPNYGPRHLQGYNAKGVPQYNQETGEVATWQCQECKCVVSYSTQHPQLLLPQNHAVAHDQSGPGFMEKWLGTTEPDLVLEEAE